MNRQIVIGAGAVGLLIVVIGLGSAAHAYRIDEHAAALFFPRKRVVAPSIPATTSATTSVTVLKMEEDGYDAEAMNAYWLSRINDLRAQKKLKPLVFDSRLADTANIWAVHMGTTGVLSHDRPNGDTMHEWIKTYDLPFTVRGVGGWYGNFFTENIGRAYADTSATSIQHAMEEVLTFMVDEGPAGDHYRTIFSEDWNRYGGGFYFEPVAEGRVRIYMAFHYASLQ